MSTNALPVAKYGPLRLKASQSQLHNSIQQSQSERLSCSLSPSNRIIWPRDSSFYGLPSTTTSSLVWEILSLIFWTLSQHQVDVCTQVTQFFDKSWCLYGAWDHECSGITLGWL